MDFDEAFARVLGHEGGLSMIPTDPGNWTGGKTGVGDLRGTNWGISAASYPGEDIAGMSLARAKELYFRDFWGPSGASSLPEAARYDVFDMSVHSGVRAAVKTLQKAVGELEDGVLGPRTLQAAQSVPGERLRLRFNGARLLYMVSLPAWPHFSRGWVKRIASNMLD